jgi:hypothetical protein
MQGISEIHDTNLGACSMHKNNKNVTLNSILQATDEIYELNLILVYTKLDLLYLCSDGSVIFWLISRESKNRWLCLHISSLDLIWLRTDGRILHIFFIMELC